MICNRFKVWQDSFSLIVAASLIGCGSSNTTGTTTAVPAQTTAVPAAAAPARPGMPAPAPGGAGHMNAAHMQMMTQTTGTSPNAPAAPAAGAPNNAMTNSEKYAAHMAAKNNSGAGSSGSSNSPSSPNMAAHASAPSSPNMAAHMSSPNPSGGGAGMNSNSPSNIDSSKMAAHGNPGGNSAPNGTMPGTAPGTLASAPGMNGAAGTNPQNAPGTNPQAQMRGANGQPGMPGQPGGAGSPAGNLTPGSVEDTLYRFCVAVADGDTAAAAEFVSPKAKGLIGQLRDGALSEEKLEEVTNAITPVTELQPNPNQTITKRSLRNKKNQVITFTVKKDKDDEYKITELTISKPKKVGQGG
jgi:hypothetical protein